MSAEDYNKLPAFIQKISSQCKDHNKKFELYCSSHACPCCVQCTTDKHKKCQDMKPLSDILQQVKSSASVQLFEKDLKNVKKNYDEASKYLITRISIIYAQKTKAIEEIRSTRKSIVDYLNKLEQIMLDDLESEHSKLKSNMATLVDQMDQRVSKIDQMQREFTEMTQYATELQMYFGLREIEKTTFQVTKYIEDLESGDNFNEQNLEVKISSALRSILKDVKSFGDIKINTTSSTLHIKTVRKDQAQHLVPKGPGIDHPSQKKLIIPEGMRSLDIYATLILPDASDGKTLVINEDGRKITTVNLNDKSQTILEVIGTDCISLFQGKIYCAVYHENKVYCYKITGEPLWTFQHQDIAKPTGITLDINGFIYIVSNENESIVVVSPDGKTCKTILSKADEITDPWEIDINRKTGLMVVSSDISDDSGDSGASYQTAFVYKI
ncbi:uncharacterized protein LOC134701511 [Mytilus trossulus]|uniref:uncharacterized protein LOC134701511 n=1 Tax=Mytilus trossulus TaxID=6551 RepID=UPI0030079801